MNELSRERYALLYGPTAGDRIRLADTAMLIEVERDLCAGRRWRDSCGDSMDGARGQ